MSNFEEAPDIQKIARELVSKIDNVDHVDVDEVLWLKETETSPKALAKCYRIGDHPMGFFTDKKYCIVVYWFNCSYMSPEQLAVLILHEMLHIPPYGGKLIDHDVQDFRSILGIDLDWSEPGKEIPDILRKDDEGKGKNTNRRRRKAPILADKG